MRRIHVEFSKFTVIGAVNFIFTFSMFFLFVKIFEINYLISLMVVSFFGMILTYSANCKWVFGIEGDFVFRGSLGKYIFAGFVSVSLNAVILKALVEKTHLDPFYVQTALIPLIVILNFSTSKFWSLKAAS
nr:GtrA family protein [Rhodoferax sp.]